MAGWSAFQFSSCIKMEIVFFQTSSLSGLDSLFSNPFSHSLSLSLSLRLSHSFSLTLLGASQHLKLPLILIEAQSHTNP